MSTLNLTRLYRAHIGAGPERPERTAFVEADSIRVAFSKIARAVGVIDQRDPDEVFDLIYNMRSAVEVMAAGDAEDIEHRLFEVGSFNGPVWVEHPLFLVTDPAPLIRKWMEAQAVRS